MLLFTIPGKMDYGNIRISQLVAILIIVIVISLIIIRRVKGYANEKYCDPIVSTKQIQQPTQSAEQQQTSTD
jgi:phosphatidylglycerol:prolipoprotein diacylglycerol transferase